MNAIVLALVLVEVTTADGARVHINPQFVTKLYPTSEALNRGPNKMVVPGGRCIVTMSDGKFLTVREECDYLRLKLEGRSR